MSFFLRTCWMWKMKQNLMRKKKKRRYQLIIIIIRIIWNPLSYWNLMLHKFILFQIEQLLFPKIALNSLSYSYVWWICHSKSWTFPMNKSWNISGTFWILILQQMLIFVQPSSSAYFSFSHQSMRNTLILRKKQTRD